jgi:hypothetical protein
MLRMLILLVSYVFVEQLVLNIVVEPTLQRTVEDSSLTDVVFRSQ